MKEILDKLSSYNLFNYLLPGIIYVVILKEVTNYDMVQENNFVGGFLYYFIGLVISRFGSLIVGSILKSKKLNFITFTDYSEYIYASDKDKKIELLSEINNMYRTLISMLCLLLLSKLFETISTALKFDEGLSYIILILCLLIMFVFAYKKQTGFIVKRVNARN